MKADHSGGTDNGGLKVFPELLGFTKFAWLLARDPVTGPWEQDLKQLLNDYRFDYSLAIIERGTQPMSGDILQGTDDSPWADCPWYLVRAAVLSVGLWGDLQAVEDGLFYF
ncbi:UNVERIFIED_CONTAM: hypothetical protein K2H54_059617 [Gekko kuhli]